MRKEARRIGPFEFDTTFDQMEVPAGMAPSFDDELSEVLNDLEVLKDLNQLQIILGKTNENEKSKHFRSSKRKRNKGAGAV